MERISEGVNNLNLADASSKKNNRIQVSNTTKRPLFFYINLAKRYLQQHNEVELSALGMGIVFLTIVLTKFYLSAIYSNVHLSFF
ncbi:hypothetical protein AKJ16_DCAP06066 [Drosera capensis]